MTQSSALELQHIPVTHNYPETVVRIVLQFSAGQSEQINRWNVIGKIPIIVSALKNAGVYREWMLGRLEELEESAKDSL
ncbi:MAG: hypothetical protein DWQ44_00080 [Bacteroidetes bacterium]|nr:MAG: hypothetical protein DWQ33_05030 [Bacteroidota bacterium]REK06027.1 MAG: hypothetical protein DWQ39_04170 [Bacteroidota bacterium]REK37085.1 MAG: hypothetical protein DWQ44_00080 [Bacteroidota bacterium]REK47522.1 MAG: hypothetical protein DWQ48_12365 [Bacteroidota bacterium]